MPLQLTLKAEILAALTTTSDVEKSPAQLREEWASKLSSTIDKHIKEALTKVIASAAPIPQDGGTGLKTSMLAAIQTI